jgi:hypothetical protein
MWAPGPIWTAWRKEKSLAPNVIGLLTISTKLSRLYDEKRVQSLVAKHEERNTYKIQNNIKVALNYGEMVWTFFFKWLRIENNGGKFLTW